ncbi:stage V sporulation protein AA [Paenibacillus koleovorans]|uniref:stage V sporulation protein AA n=1 Tax=Paenibacillus koleovorans TaxID=121608 RepID=UPI000FD9183B|nr:stage V sporulation protein AA [Paenibacillus koleovorans]
MQTPVHTSPPVLYMRLRKRIMVKKGDPVTLGDVAQMLVDPEWESRFKQLVLHTPGDADGSVLLLDMLRVVEAVRGCCPGVQIEHYGDPHVLVEIMSPARKPNPILLVIVWLLLFFGSGLAIMNFHVDVSMMEVHRKLFKMISGREVEHPYWLQIPYSFGLGAGMVIFFNQLFKKKFTEEPSPLEVEMFMYQENLNRYVITEEYMKLQDNGKPR